MQGFRYILYRDWTLFHGYPFYKIKDMYLGHTMQTFARTFGGRLLIKAILTRMNYAPKDMF